MPTITPQELASVQSLASEGLDVAVLRIRDMMAMIRDRDNGFRAPHALTELQRAERMISDVEDTLNAAIREYKTMFASYGTSDRQVLDDLANARRKKNPARTVKNPIGAKAYRGYLITPSMHGHHVSKDGTHITTAKTDAAAKKAIDALHPSRKNAAKKNAPRRGKKKPTKVTVGVWEERDNLTITLYDADTDDVLATWTDDNARQMFDDGFFEKGRNLESSVVEYAKSIGII